MAIGWIIGDKGVGFRFGKIRAHQVVSFQWVRLFPHWTQAIKKGAPSARPRCAALGVTRMKSTGD
jgi:hypothetical protein